VTIDQFAAFVRATRYEASSKCETWSLEGGTLARRMDRSWRDPGFPQEGPHPVVCLTWNDAMAYVAWLAKNTRKPYRLLSEAEWNMRRVAGRRQALIRVSGSAMTKRISAGTATAPISGS
jgi:formylglycine-generating enzyme required for sulfatase activity